ncbi:Rossmann fold domain-containing protein [Sphingomonas parapaucimobilis]|uniref:Rossmann fold domain-containing protein n=1 Tax=Sphingomonas parapaucimobilis TaxID=28213 RepID=UPI00321A27E3
MTARRVDLAPDADIAGVVAGHPGEDLVLVIRPGRDALSQAMLEAAIPPLAIAAAPGARINAVIPAEGAAEEAVAAAVDYLAAAHAVTGQSLIVGV